MKLIDDARRKGFDEKIRESSLELKASGDDGKADPYSLLVPGPYTLEFCKEFLEKILKAQKKIRQTGPDPPHDTHSGGRDPRNSENLADGAR